MQLRRPAGIRCDRARGPARSPARQPQLHTWRCPAGDCPGGIARLRNHDDLLPRLRRIEDVIGVRLVQGKARRLESLVVTADTVSRDQITRRSCGRGAARGGNLRDGVSGSRQAAVGIRGHIETGQAPGWQHLTTDSQCFTAGRESLETDRSPPREADARSHCSLPHRAPGAHGPAERTNYTARQPSKVSPGILTSVVTVVAHDRQGCARVPIVAIVSGTCSGPDRAVRASDWLRA
jgi:hypothetical protein